ncbi:Eukaryotic translation initiation factor 2D, partial [Chytridiales sp. JEL 0842]
ILSLYPILTDDSLSTLLPKDSELFVTKISTHQDSHGQLYTLGPQPLFIRLGKEGKLYPTIYTLWKLPHLLPTITTHGPVMRRLFDGADLMLPGVVVPPNGFETNFQVGDVVAILMRGNPYPLAVGRMLVSRDAMIKNGMRGKGVEMVHTYGDTLWALTKEEPPEVIEAVADSEDDDEYEVVDTEADENSSNLGVQPLEDDVTEEMASMVMDETPSEVGDQQIVEVGIETEMVESSGPPSVKPADMDKILEEAFLTALRLKLPDDPKSYPIGSSVLYDTYILPSRMLGTTIDIKNSTYKKETNLKVSKFLKAMEKKGYVKLKERNGDTILMSINKKHPQVAAFEPPRKLAVEASSKPASSSSTINSSSKASVSTSVADLSTEPLKIVELFKANGSIAKLWAEIGIQKDALLTKAEVRSALDDYVKSKNLSSSSDPRLVKLDPFLTEALLKKDELSQVEFLARDSITQRVLEKMSPFHELTPPSGEPVIKKGSVKPILITVESKNGRRVTTKVVNVENFGIEPEDLAAQLKIRCASSTSVTPLPGKSAVTLYEVMIQGSKIREVCDTLAEKYGVPFGSGKPGVSVKDRGLKGGTQSKYVEVVDKT